MSMSNDNVIIIMVVGCYGVVMSCHVMLCVADHVSEATRHVYGGTSVIRGDIPHVHEI
jgi:hypothetical protein